MPNNIATKIQIEIARQSGAIAISRHSKLELDMVLAALDDCVRPIVYPIRLYLIHVYVAALSHRSEAGALDHSSSSAILPVTDIAYTPATRRSEKRENM